MRKWLLLIIVIITIASGILLGIIVHIYNDEKMKTAMIEYVNTFNDKKEKEDNKVKIKEKEIVKVSSNEVKTSPNTELIFSTYYAKCGHIEVKKQEIEKDDVNKTEVEIKEKYKDWIIKSFNSNEIQLYRECNTICKNHYIVKEKEGIIAIYSLDENNQENLKDETDISTKYLPEEDKKLLKKGIKANSYTELQRILSDYE